MTARKMTAEERCRGSLNAEYAAVCGGKLRHQNFLTAMHHAVSLAKLLGHQEIAIYRCTFCGAEHVGTVTHKGLWGEKKKNKIQTYGIGQASFENFIGSRDATVSGKADPA